MKIIVTGARRLADLDLVHTSLKAVVSSLSSGEGHPLLRDTEVTIIHGGATGADELADQVAKAYGWAVVKFLPDRSKGKRGYYLRNKQMVDFGADVCVAFPVGESKGTRMTMALARQAGIPVVNFGEVWEEEKDD